MSLSAISSVLRDGEGYDRLICCATLRLLVGPTASAAACTPSSIVIGVPDAITALQGCS